ncbi:MAG: POTRA domain-containing protein [Planctomycetota bacterium]
MPITNQPPSVRRLVLRAAVAAVAGLACAASAPAAIAQGASQFGSPAARPPGMGGPTGPRRSKGLSEFATDEQVASIGVKGNESVPSSRILAQMQTRVGRPFDSRALAADVKKLSSLDYFVTVRPLTRSDADGLHIILEVVERRTLRYVEYLGNNKLKDKKLAEATGLAVGGAIDPYAVAQGREKIEALYRSNGFGRVHVTVIDGDDSSDPGVCYSINEGPQERIWSVGFEGNAFASDGQLKTKIKSKPNITRLFGGKLDREQLDADVNRLTSYYRAFGFFRARVGRTVELNDDGSWATIRFVINEGPRYAIRNVTINGAERFSDEALRTGLKLTDGQQFEKSKLSADVQWIREVYGANGYVFADIQPETLFLEEPGKVDLVYNLDEGEQWRVGQVNVNIGGDASHTKITTALNRLGLRPGDILDTTKLKDAERRLGAAGIFANEPARGVRPSIRYEPSEHTKERLAREAEAEERDREGFFRGQSPAEPRRHTAYKAPASSVYRVEQSVGGSAEDTLYRSGTVFATPPPIENQRYGAAVDLPRYGGTSVSPTGPGAAPVGYTPAPVQQLGVTDPSGTSVSPTQFATPAPGRYPPPGGTLPPPVPAPGPPTAQYGSPSAPAAAAPAINPPPPGVGPYGSADPYGVAPPPAAPVYAPSAPAPYAPSQSFVPPVRPSRPPQPVNTQLFPSQVYAPTPVPPPNDPFADLFISLEETQTGRFMVGAAVNSDAGVVGQIMLDERNFDWRRIPRSWQDFADGTAFRGGGQRFRLEAAPGTEVQRYLASWQQPYLFDSPISLNLSGSYFDRRFDDWDEQRLGGRIGLGYQWLDRDLTASLTYRGENVNIHDVRDPTLDDYADVLGDNSLHGFGIRLITDKRDNPFLATEGYYLGLTLEQVVGSFTYGRAELDARSYVLLTERPDHTGRHVLTYQTRLGFTGADTPVYDRFYAGGFSTLRGYDFRGASPIDTLSGGEVGGDFRWINTLEYMFPLTADDMVNGVVFVDHGTVNRSVSLDNYRVAPGVGLRVVVPAMGPAPIALDFAFPVAGPDFDEEQIFTFNVGFQR